jgi:hypothetical protein
MVCKSGLNKKSFLENLKGKKFLEMEPANRLTVG